LLQPRPARPAIRLIAYMLKLVLASLLALGISSAIADARRMPVPMPVQPTLVFEIDHRNKADSNVPESHFELRADGTWRYLRTVKQSIQLQTGGKLSRAKTQRIRALLAQAPWRTTTDELTCKAFAMSNTQFSVAGQHVWTEELCSGHHLDRRSARRLAQVMAIVEPILPR
jgi:hypothetical protein